MAGLIQRAGREMSTCGANLWSVNTSKNHYFMHGHGADLRRQAKQTGIFRDTTTRLGLIYGAFFGFRVLHDPSLYTRFGQIKDDVERSLRYWHRDGVVIRFKRYALVKMQKPGKFIASKGGISAGSSASSHLGEGTRALQAILGDFAWRYARLPRDGQRCGDCGLIWSAGSEEQEPFPPKKRARAQAVM